VRNIRKTLISIAFLLFFFSLISNVYAATPISSCTVIDSPGEYVLTNDIDASGNFVCINIQSNNVSLNCMGHKLIGRFSTSFDTAYGIYISRSSQTDTYITIRDCYLHDFAYFIAFERSNYNIVDGVTCYGGESSQTCVSLYNVFYSNFSNIYCDRGRGMSFCTTCFGSYNNFTNIYAIDTQVSDGLGNNIYNNYTVVFVNLAGSVDAFTFGYGVRNIRIYNSRVYNARYGIYSSNLYDSIILNSTFVANCTFYLEGGSNNYIYNNLINSSTYVCGSPGLNYWNTTLTQGTNIVGGPYIGGNYWGKPDGTGYSDTCVDANHDGICDNPYALDSNNIDYLPLARYVPPPPYTEITNCTPITQPGEYRLVNDILNYDGTPCIDIQSDNVTFDCQWHIISGSTTASTTSAASQIGIYITSRYNVSVTNCIFANFTAGIQINYGGQNRVSNIILRDYMRDFGVYLYSSNNNSISNLTALNQVHATMFQLAVSKYNVLSKIYYNYSGYCFTLIYSQYNTITDSVFANCIVEVGLDSSDTTNYNLIYNNIFNSTTISILNTNSINYWNTTLTPGTNIVGGPLIGGNYWGKIDGTGYSDTCVDANHDGICDNPYTLVGNNIDYLPLAKYVPPPPFSVVFNYNSVDFGTVTPNTIAEAKSINYNVSVTSASDYKVSVNATDWSGATTIPANTIYFAVNDTLDKLSFVTAKQLSNAVQQVAIFPSTVTTNYHAFYFAVPVVPAGTYTAIITITYEVV